jgi:superfamily II DNA/RNA helicase
VALWSLRLYLALGKHPADVFLSWTVSSFRCTLVFYNALYSLSEALSRRATRFQPFISLPPDSAFFIWQLRTAGFTSPTPIQAQTWPIAMQGRDIVAIAKTGSGKTLGYLVPAFQHLERMRSNSRLGPSVLVLAPTRELATQIQDECVKFGRSSRLTSTVRLFSSMTLYGRAICGAKA